MAWFFRNYDIVLLAAWQHLQLVGITLTIATAVSLVLGVWSARNPTVNRICMTITGIFYSIPSLAFFALLIPFLGLGKVPAVVGLVGYSLMALIRNIVTGIQNVPSDVIEAATGMGLTRWQILYKIELPLALPVILAGVRVVTVTVIGISTVAAYINAGGLGTLIFTGIAQLHGPRIVAGAVSAGLMAVLADWGLQRLQRRLMAQ